MKLHKLTVGVVVFLLNVTPSPAPPLPTVNFQGVLRDAGGNPLDGSYDMVFRFFDDTDELLIDSHLAAGTGAVQVQDGLFNVALGSGDRTDGSAPGNISTLDEIFDRTVLEPVDMEIEVSGEVLSPRIPITPAPQAWNANHLNGIASGQFIRGDVDGDITADLSISGSLYVETTLNAGPATLIVGQLTKLGSAKVDNLNADLIDGLDSSSFLTAETDPQVGALGSGDVPTWNGTALEPGAIRDLGDGTVYADGGLMLAGQEIRVNQDGPDESQVIYFYDNGSDISESIGWDDADDRFEISDQVAVAGELRVGDVTQTPLGYNAFGGTAPSPASGDMNSVGDVFIGGDVEIGETLYLAGDLRLQSAGPDADQAVYFFEDGSATGESVLWDDSDDRFDLSDALAVRGALTVGLAGSNGYSFFGKGTVSPASGDMSTTDDVFIQGDLEVNETVYAESIDAAGGTFNLVASDSRIRADAQVRVMFDDDDSTTANFQGWYHDGIFDAAHLLAQLFENGNLKIGGTLSENASFDLAESFLAGESLEPGEVVRLDPARPGSVLRSRRAGDPGVLGVVSTKPGVLLGSAPFHPDGLRETWGESVHAEFVAVYESLRGRVLAEDPDLRHRMDRIAAGRATSTELPAEVDDEIRSRALALFCEERLVPIALAGRVPVKVDASFGAIVPGDSLTASPVPGVAMRAAGAGPVIGTALEGLDEGRGKILAFVHREHHTPASVITETRERQEKLAAGLEERTPNPVTGIQSVPGDLQIVLDRGADDAARFSIFRDGAEDGALGEEVFRVDEEGNVYARGAFRPSAMDLAEYFPVAGPVETGDVVTIDSDADGLLRRADTMADPAVAGIVSSEPGVLLGSGMTRIASADAELAVRLDEARRYGDREEEARTWKALEDRFRRAHAPIGLSGSVPCKVDAGYGAIRPGELLTASPTPGHAMRASEIVPGAVIGKALESLPSGTGTIRVLVMPR